MSDSRGQYEDPFKYGPYCYKFKRRKCSYRRKKDAKDQARRLKSKLRKRGKGLDIFKCGCGYYHLGGRELE